MNRATNILVVEDEIIIARDIQRILKKSPNITVKVALGYYDAIDFCREFKPDLVISDINFENEAYDGIDLISELKKTLSFQVIFLTAHSDSGILSRAQAAEPENYLVKPFNEQQLSVAVQFALNKTLLDKTPSPLDELRQLTPTEVKVLRLVGESLTSKDIANELNISKRTVDNHRSNICRKLGLPSNKNSLISWVLLQKKNLRF